MDVQEKGEPLVIPIHSLSELSPALTKAACVQAMHEHRPENAPITTAMDCNMLNPLIKGALLAQTLPYHKMR